MALSLLNLTHSIWEMKTSWGRGWVLVALWLFTFALESRSVLGAVLKWNPNPANQNIAFYTVYIESPLGTTAHQVDGTTHFDLLDLVPNIPYTLYVTATSTAGLESARSTEIPYLLGLETAPVIVSQPKSIGAALGLPVLLSVTATGTNLRYQWFKDGEPLTGETNSSISISLLSLLSQGAYHATVSNSFGSVETDRAFVSIAYPPRVLSSPFSTNLAVGGTIQLTASATGTRPFTYQWFRGDQPLSAATNAILFISSASTNDSGAYRVEISNIAGLDTSAVANVSVIEPPGIRTPPMGGHVVRGALLQFSVTASGSGPLAYRWFFNEQPLAGATNASLTFSSATEAHTGSYKVEISNSMGAILSAPIEVQVWPPISIVQQPIATTNLLIGDQLRLAIVANGPESMTYQWFRGTVKLDGQTGPELVLSEVGSADGGNYTVAVSSLAQTVVSAVSVVTIVTDPLASDCSLTMLKNTNGQLGITAQAPPNATFDLQLTDTLTSPNWRRIATLTADATGHMETTINVNATGSGFVRAVRR